MLALVSKLFPMTRSPGTAPSNEFLFSSKVEPSKIVVVPV